MFYDILLKYYFNLQKVFHSYDSIIHFHSHFHIPSNFLLEYESSLLLRIGPEQRARHRYHLSLGLFF